MTPWGHCINPCSETTRQLLVHLVMRSSAGDGVLGTATAILLSEKLAKVHVPPRPLTKGRVERGLDVLVYFERGPFLLPFSILSPHSALHVQVQKPRWRNDYESLVRVSTNSISMLISLHRDSNSPKLWVKRPGTFGEPSLFSVRAEPS